MSRFDTIRAEADMGYDIIQTDWMGMCRDYLYNSEKIYKK